MFYAALLVRIALAFVAGWSAYMVAAVVDVLAPVGGAEAFVGIFIQAVIGAVFTAAAIALVGAVGLPFYALRGGWVRRAWPIVSALIAVAGVIFYAAAWLPAYRDVVPHPDPQFSSMGQTISVANFKMELGGWLAMQFGIVHLTLRRPASARSATAMSAAHP